MLVLTRQQGQAVIINGDIVVRVMSINGQNVRIGIDAPRDVKIDREEIALRKQQEKDNED